MSLIANIVNCTAPIYKISGMEIVELRPLLHLIKPVFGQVYVWQDGSQLTMVDTGIPGSQQELPPLGTPNFAGLTCPNPNFWQPHLEPLRNATTSNAER